MLETQGDLKQAEKKDAEEREAIARREEAAAEVGREVGVEVQRTGGDVDGKEEGKEGGIQPVDAGEIDWFAYYLAVSSCRSPLKLLIQRCKRRPTDLPLFISFITDTYLTIIRNSLTTSMSPILSLFTRHPR